MSSTPTTVDINGFALRELRIRSGVEARPLAEQVGVADSYIRRIETGHTKRVSAQVFKNLLDALKITDRRVLLAAPHTDSAAA